jgi:dihydrofolate synthase/folylpolyglutamate synthase
VTYSEAIRQLYALGNELKNAKFDLERITGLLEQLGNPHLRGRFVHVAGTNGKGSTSAMIESGLRHAGLRTGLYTSPHLIEPTERIKIGGVPISGEEFAAAFARIPEPLTYFETVTAMAFLIFAERAEITVLEVGLGGRLDATNVVRPELCVITPIDFDHEAFLGKSIEAIAGEKAGILKPGVPAVFATQRPEALAVLRARTVPLPLLEADEVEVHRRGSRFRIDGMRVECPLAGAHQVENARVAVTALRHLGIGNAAIQSGIAAARWPGRLERLRESPELIVDGAHNPAGARALAAYVDEFYEGERLTLIFGAMRDKSIEEIAEILFPRFDEVILTAPKQPRAMSPEVLREMLVHPNVRTASGLEEALGMVNGTAFVSGSLFLVGEAEQLLQTPQRQTEPRPRGSGL